MFADYKNKLPGKAGKTLSCFLRGWEEAGGGSPEEKLPNGIQSSIFPARGNGGGGCLPEATPRLNGSPQGGVLQSLALRLEL